MTKQELLQQMVEELKSQGLPIAEDVIEKVLEVFEKLTVKYIEESDSKMDDMALPLVKIIFEMGKKAADKIDGVEEKKA
jgi:hypothetical protein